MNQADPTITDKFERNALEVARAKPVPATNPALLAEKNKVGM